MADRDLGSIINERRLGLGYSLGQLANRLGTTASTVRAWERGEATPDDAMLSRLSSELRLDGAELASAPRGATTPSRGDDATAAFAGAVFSDAGNTGDDEPGDLQPDAAPEPDGPPRDPVAEASEATPEVEPNAGAAPAEPLSEPDDLDEPAPTAMVAAVAVDPGGDGQVDRSGEPPELADIDDALPEEISAETGSGDVDDASLVDLPTEAVPVVVSPEPALAVGGTAVATRPRTEVEPVVPQVSGFFGPVEQFFTTIFDPKRRYLFWIRTVMTFILFLVFLRVLAWAVPEFFDVLGEIFDTIESTPTETEPPSVVDGVN